MTAQPDRPTRAEELAAEARELYRAPTLHPKRPLELLPALAAELEAAIARERSVQATNDSLADCLRDREAEIEAAEATLDDEEAAHQETLDLLAKTREALASLVAAHAAEDGPALVAAFDAAKTLTRTAPEGAPPP